MAKPEGGPSAPEPEIKPKHVQRAAVEALTTMRPQPTANHVTTVLESLAELDENGVPKHKFKDAKAAATAARTKARELLEADKKAAADIEAAKTKQAEEDEKLQEQKTQAKQHG
jgi:hypothetical protein